MRKRRKNIKFIRTEAQSNTVHDAVTAIDKQKHDNMDKVQNEELQATTTDVAITNENEKTDENAQPSAIVNQSLSISHVFYFHFNRNKN